MPVSKGANQKTKGQPEVQGLQGVGDLAPLLEMRGSGIQPPDARSVSGVPGDGVGVGRRCPVCDDTGMRAEMRGKDRFMTPCPCMARKAIERRMLAANIPPRYMRLTFATLEPGGPAQQAAKMRSQWYVDHFMEPRERNGIAFTGPVGTGKTQLAVCILREVATRYGATIAYVNLVDLAKNVQETFGERGRSERDFTGPAKTAQLALLDEMGGQQWTEWRGDLVSEIVAARYDTGLPTLITSNKPFEMARAASEQMDGYAMARGPDASLGFQLGARAMDRLREMCEPVSVTGQSWRGR